GRDGNGFTQIFTSRHLEKIRYGGKRDVWHAGDRRLLLCEGGTSDEHDDDACRNKMSFHDVLPRRYLGRFSPRFRRFRRRRWGVAGPVGGVLQLAGSHVLRGLWVRAERARQIVLRISGHDLRGSGAVFAPLLESTDRVERLRSIAATTMSHAGHHEESG